MNFSDLPVVTKRPTVPAAEEIFGLYFPVLDHGFVSLVDYMGGDSAIEQAARVAYGVGTRKATETRGLIRYLHWSISIVGSTCAGAGPDLRSVS